MSASAIVSATAVLKMKQQDESALHARRREAQAPDLAVDDAIVDRQHVARAVDERVDALADRLRVEARLRRIGKQVVERLLAPHGHAERVRLRVVERQLADFLGELRKPRCTRA